MTAPNTSPIYTLTPLNDWGKVTAADTGTDGTGANVVLVHTAGAQGDYVSRFYLQPISTSGSTTTSAAVARFYMNNGTTVGTAANNILFFEFSLGAIAVNTAATAAAIGYQLPYQFQMAAGYKIYCGVSAMAANTQWNVMAVAGDY